MQNDTRGCNFTIMISSFCFRNKPNNKRHIVGDLIEIFKT